MALLIGALLALAVGLLCTFAGLDRDRALYPAVTIVVASYYVLFAAIGATPDTLSIELLCGVLFVAAAVLGFRSSLWFVVAALASHGIFDLFHAHAIANPGVPAWWPPFCLAFDVAAAAYLASSLKLGRIPLRRVAVASLRTV